MTKIIQSIPLFLVATLMFNISLLFLIDSEIKHSKKSELAHNYVKAKNYNPEPEIEIIPIAPPIEEPEIVEPILVFGIAEEVDTLLPVVSIIENTYRPCGCQPSPLNLIALPIDSLNETEDYSIFAEPIFATPELFEAKVFPNPTSSSSKLEVDIKDDGIYQISLYNMNGQLIKSLHSGELFNGRQFFDLELDDQNSGMYLITILSENQSETLKVQKVN